MDDNTLQDIYNVKQIDTEKLEASITIGHITEKEKFFSSKTNTLGFSSALRVIVNGLFD